MQGRPNNRPRFLELHPLPILRLHFQSSTISFCFALLLLWLSKLEENPLPSKIKHGRVVEQAHK